MPRPTRQEIDDEIVEHASALFARHGFKDTSLQSIADAAGYSKTGLLHRFPSKEALWAAVVERCVGLCRQIADDVAGLPVGPERDRVVLTGLVDLTLGHPGVVALVLSVFSTIDRVEDTPLLLEIGESVLGAFGDAETQEKATAQSRDRVTAQPRDRTTAQSRDRVTAQPQDRVTERRIRVVGALGALAVAGIALRHSPHDDVREHLVTAAYDTLGHHAHPQIPAARKAPAHAPTEKAR